MLILGQKSYFLGPTIFKIPQPTTDISNQGEIYVVKVKNEGKGEVIFDSPLLIHAKSW